MFPELMGISLLVASVVSVHITSKQPEYIIGVDLAKGPDRTGIYVEFASAVQATDGQDLNVQVEFEPWLIVPDVQPKESIAEILTRLHLGGLR